MATVVAGPLFHTVGEETERALILHKTLKTHPRLKEAYQRGGDAWILETMRLVETAGGPMTEPRLSCARKAELDVR